MAAAAATPAAGAGAGAAWSPGWIEPGLLHETKSRALPSSSRRIGIRTQRINDLTEISPTRQVRAERDYRAAMEVIYTDTTPWVLRPIPQNPKETPLSLGLLFTQRTRAIPEDASTTLRTIAALTRKYFEGEASATSERTLLVKNLQGLLNFNSILPEFEEDLLQNGKIDRLELLMHLNSIPVSKEFDDFHLAITAVPSDERFIGLPHDCAPNCSVRMAMRKPQKNADAKEAQESESHLELYTLRPISKGELLTINWTTEPFSGRPFAYDRQWWQARNFGQADLGLNFPTRMRFDCTCPNLCGPLSIKGQEPIMDLFAVRKSIVDFEQVMIRLELMQSHRIDPFHLFDGTYGTLELIAEKKTNADLFENSMFTQPAINESFLLHRQASDTFQNTTRQLWCKARHAFWQVMIISKGAYDVQCLQLSYRNYLLGILHDLDADPKRGIKFLPLWLGMQKHEPDGEQRRRTGETTFIPKGAVWCWSADDIMTDVLTAVELRFRKRFRTILLERRRIFTAHNDSMFEIAERFPGDETRINKEFKKNHNDQKAALGIAQPLEVLSIRENIFLATSMFFSEWIMLLPPFQCDRRHQTIFDGALIKSSHERKFCAVQNHPAVYVENFSSEKWWIFDPTVYPFLHQWGGLCMTCGMHGLLTAALHRLNDMSMNHVLGEGPRVFNRRLSRHPADPDMLILVKDFSNMMGGSSFAAEMHAIEKWISAKRVEISPVPVPSTIRTRKANPIGGALD